MEAEFRARLPAQLYHKQMRLTSVSLWDQFDMFDLDQVGPEGTCWLFSTFCEPSLGEMPKSHYPINQNSKFCRSVALVRMMTALFLLKSTWLSVDFSMCWFSVWSCTYKPHRAFKNWSCVFKMSRIPHAHRWTQVCECSGLRKWCVTRRTPHIRRGKAWEISELTVLPDQYSQHQQNERRL